MQDADVVRLRLGRLVGVGGGDAPPQIVPVGVGRQLTQVVPADRAVTLG